jgi:hypothetical protein
VILTTLYFIECGEGASNRERAPIFADQTVSRIADACICPNVTRDFTEEYDQMLRALHKNNASDACLMTLFDDHSAVRPEINAALDSLKFK